MKVKIGINGFGRIGRLLFRALEEQQDENVEVSTVNDLCAPDNLAYLLKYDSVHRRFSREVESRVEDDGGGWILVNGRSVRVFNGRRDPASIPWREAGVDIVVESSGMFTQAEQARGHLRAGARKVIVTAPSKGADVTLVLGVNDHMLDLSRHEVLSAASCTTNCVAPLVHVLLKEGIGIEEGLMTTVHACTATQNLVDGPGGKDWRGGRAASNVVPATTGAAEAVALVCPEVKGKLTGMAFRVPVSTGSVVDLTVRTERPASLAQINDLMRKASRTYLKGILDYTEEPLVSGDIIHNSFSAIYDAGVSISLNERFFKLVGWYDNEWAYACRVADLVRKVAANL